MPRRRFRKQSSRTDHADELKKLSISQRIEENAQSALKSAGINNPSLKQTKNMMENIYGCQEFRTKKEINLHGTKWRNTINGNPWMVKKTTWSPGGRFVNGTFVSNSSLPLDQQKQHGACFVYE